MYGKIQTRGRLATPIGMTQWNRLRKPSGGNAGLARMQQEIPPVVTVILIAASRKTRGGSAAGVYPGWTGERVREGESVEVEDGDAHNEVIVATCSQA